MTIQTVTPRDFGLLFPRPAHIFNSVAFAEHNRGKCDDGDVRYLVFSDSKVRAGIILGRRGSTLHSPFSAPFGGLSTANAPLSMECVDNIIDSLCNYACEEKMSARLTLPPLLPETSLSDLTSKTIQALISRGFHPSADICYYLDLTRPANPAKSARKKLRQALDAGLKFEALSPTPTNIARVYEVIKANHIHRGYEMRRSLDDYLSTDTLMDAQYFIVTLGGVDIAAAANYTVCPGVTIGAGWGDLPGYSQFRPMNMLANGMEDFYRSEGYKIFDLGPAAENGTIFPGLCSFKESLGALTSLKFSFRT